MPTSPAPLAARGSGVEQPSELNAALTAGLAEASVPTVIDIVATRDPAAMLPGVDTRTLVVKQGDRPA